MAPKRGERIQAIQKSSRGKSQAGHLLPIHGAIFSMIIPEEILATERRINDEGKENEIKNQHNNGTKTRIIKN